MYRLFVAQQVKLQSRVFEQNYVSNMMMPNKKFCHLHHIQFQTQLTFQNAQIDDIFANKCCTDMNQHKPQISAAGPSSNLYCTTRLDFLTSRELTESINHFHMGEMSQGGYFSQILSLFFGTLTAVCKQALFTFFQSFQLVLLANHVCRSRENQVFDPLV